MKLFVKIFLLCLVPAVAIAQKDPNDIVKAHGGVPIPIGINGIKVETKEGEGSALIIQLPIV